MANATSLPALALAQVATPTNPNPRLAAPIDAVTTTLTFTAPIVDHTGAVETRAFLLSIRDTATSYVQHCYCPANCLSVDGKTATGVVRGIRLEGLDYTTGDSTLAIPANADSPIFMDVNPIYFYLMVQAMQGGVSSGGVSWIVGRNLNEDIKVFAGIGNTNNPFWGYDHSNNRWIFSNDGVSSTPFGTGAGVSGGSGISVSSGVISVNTSDNTKFVSTSSGAGDSGKVPFLDGTGKLATGFIPSGTDSSKVSLSTFTTKGDIVAATGSGAVARVAAGTNGQILIADSSQSAGVRYGTLTRRNGVDSSRSGNASSGSQTIAHGLGVIPTYVKITASCLANTKGVAKSTGVFDGSGQNCGYEYMDSNTNTDDAALSAGKMIFLENGAGSANRQTATIAVDATNITITWTLGGTGLGTSINLLWEVQAIV